MSSPVWPRPFMGHYPEPLMPGAYSTPWELGSLHATYMGGCTLACGNGGIRQDRACAGALYEARAVLPASCEVPPLRAACCCGPGPCTASAFTPGNLSHCSPCAKFVTTGHSPHGGGHQGAPQPCRVRIVHLCLPVTLIGALYTLLP